MKSWADRIHQHATVHYNEDGWDILVECWDDVYIEEHYRGCKTYEEALAVIAEALSTMDSYRRDIQAEIF